MNHCLIDTGPMVALFNKSDRYHDSSIEFISNFKGTLYSTLASVTEAVYLLSFNQKAQLALLNWISDGAVHIEAVNQHDFESLITKFTKYSDVPLDFADGCLVVIAERLGIQDIATVDSDFEIYRLPKNKKFKIHVKNQVT